MLIGQSTLHESTAKHVECLTVPKYCLQKSTDTKNISKEHSPISYWQISAISCCSAAERIAWWNSSNASPMRPWIISIGYRPSFFGQDIGQVLSLRVRGPSDLVHKLAKKRTRPISSLIIWLAPRAGKMNQILRCDWLPEWARWSYLARSGLPMAFCKKNFPESHIINPLLTRFVQEGGDRGGRKPQNRTEIRQKKRTPHLIFYQIAKPHVHWGHNMKAAVSNTCMLI